MTLDNDGVVGHFDELVARFTPSGVVAQDGALLVEFQDHDSVVIRKTLGREGEP